MIDFTRPVGVLFVAVLHFLTDEDRPQEQVAAFRRRMASGSMLAISHITADGTPPGVQAAIRAIYAEASAPAVFRTRHQIEAFFGGLDLVRPGLAAGEAWQDSNLVFCHEDGRQYFSDALNWRSRRMTRRAGIGHWHAHEGRHTAVSIMSTNGVPIQDISDTAGHKSTHVTETVYRHVIVPAIRGGASVMDSVFGERDADGPGSNTGSK